MDYTINTSLIIYSGYWFWLLFRPSSDHALFRIEGKNCTVI